MLQLYEPFRNHKSFIISFYNSSDLGIKNKKVFLLQFLVDISANTDPVSKNLGNPTDPDPLSTELGEKYILDRVIYRNEGGGHNFHRCQIFTNFR